MDLRDYFSYFIKRIWIIALTLILSSILSGAMTYFNEVKYLSTPKIIIGPQTTVSKDGKFTSNLVNVISDLIDNEKVVERLNAVTGLKLDQDSIKGIVSTDLNDLHQRIYLIVSSTDKETVRLVADKLPDILAAASKELFNVDNLMIVKSDKIVTQGKSYKKNIVAGAVAGAGLGFMIVFILLIYDDRLRNRFDIKRLFGIDYLGSASAVSSNNGDARDNFSLICTRLLLKLNKMDGKAVSNIVAGGEQNNEYTYNLSNQMASLGKKTLYIELDKDSKASIKTTDTVKHGISDALSNGKPGYAEVIYKTDNPNLDAIPFGTQCDISLQMLLKDEFVNIINNARADYDVVMINSPYKSGIDHILSLSSACDGTMLTVREGVVKTQDAENLIENLKQTGYTILGYNMI